MTTKSTKSPYPSVVSTSESFHAHPRSFREGFPTAPFDQGCALQEHDGLDDPIVPARQMLHNSIPSVAHQRLSRTSMPAYSSPMMPYLLMDEDDVVCLPRRRTLARLNDELDDDPVLKWYEDRIHHAQAEASAIAQSHVNDICTPKPRHISVIPPYTTKMYPEPVSSRIRHKYRTPVTEAMKPVRRNIEIKSRFDRAQPGVQNYRRIGASAERQQQENQKPEQETPVSTKTQGDEREQKEEADE